MYEDLPSLVTLPTDSNADIYSTLLPKAYGPFQILQVTEHTLKLDENGISNITSIDCTTTVVQTIQHPHRFKVSKTSSKDKATLYVNYLYMEAGSTPSLLKDAFKKTETTFSRNGDFYTDMRLPTATQTHPDTSKNSMADSKETVHGKQRTSLEDNCDSLNVTTPSPTTSRTSTENSYLEYTIKN